MTLTKNLLERLRDNSNKEGFQVVQNENFQASIPNNFPGVSDLVSNELALISDIVKSDVSLSSYHSRNSKLYELLDLLVKSLENIVIKHDDLVKYLVTMDKQESYLPVLFNSNKKAIETIMSLDCCLTYQSSATSSFIPQERLMELVLDSVITYQYIIRIMLCRKTILRG
ncbi:unnamed protein product [Schistosoma turkestanicum]|nr:unnamed protein product [Schistosoma turkestanicum]